MNQIRQYFNTLFSLAFRQKSNITLLQDNLRNNPQGIFYSIFITGEHKIVIDKNFGNRREINYKAYHLLVGNNFDNISYTVASDLPYEYQNRVHYQKICNFNELPKKIQTKLVLNLNNLKTYEGSKTFLQINSMVKEKIPTFIFPDEASYEQINVVFMKEKISNMLQGKKESIKRVKV